MQHNSSFSCCACLAHLPHCRRLSYQPDADMRELRKADKLSDSVS